MMVEGEYFEAEIYNRRDLRKYTAAQWSKETLFQFPDRQGTWEVGTVGVYSRDLKTGKNLPLGTASFYKAAWWK